MTSPWKRNPDKGQESVHIEIMMSKKPTGYQKPDPVGVSSQTVFHSHGDIFESRNFQMA